MGAPNFLSCTVEIEADGVALYRDETGRAVALKLPKGGVADIRPEPPFYAMSPCPYCEARKDRNHLPLKHVDPFLGEKVDRP